MSIVIINISDVDITFDLSVGNFDIKDSNVYRTSLSENCVSAGKFKSEDLTLPKKSITTVALTGTSIPAKL